MPLRRVVPSVRHQEEISNKSVRDKKSNNLNFNTISQFKNRFFSKNCYQVD